MNCPPLQVCLRLCGYIYLKHPWLKAFTNTHTHTHTDTHAHIPYTHCNWGMNSIQIYHSWEALVESMGSEVPSAVLFSEGRSPEENSRQWKEPKAHRFNWCLEKRNDIFVLYPSSTTFYGSFQLLSRFYVSHFPLNFATPTACMHVHRPKCSLSNSKLILTSNAALSMSILA